jgi:hypothetical protein
MSKREQVTSLSSLNFFGGTTFPPPGGMNSSGGKSSISRFLVSAADNDGYSKESKPGIFNVWFLKSRYA